MDCRRTRIKISHVYAATPSICALNLLKAEDQLQGSERSPKVISIASWKRRKYNQHLAQKIFSMFEFSLDHKKIAQVFERIGSYEAIAA